MNSLNVIMLARYGSLGASSRLRSIQYLPFLKQAGINPVISSFMGDNVLSYRYRRGKHSLRQLIPCYIKRIAALLRRNKYDLVWIEKESLPWVPVCIELALLRGVPYVLDYDDAVFHNYDQHRSRLVRKLMGKRLDQLMAKSALVVCGNSYLAARAYAAGAPRVEILPTVINLNRYALKVPSSSGVETSIQRIVWIGSPSTVRYLDVIVEPLRALAKRVPFILRIIGVEFKLPGVSTEYVTWAENTEVEK